MGDSTFPERDIRAAIEADVVDVSRSPSALGAGWFGIPRQVFCFVDFLGAVAYNNRRDDHNLSQTWKAVRFIEEFFPAEYAPYSNLLVAMWRHGTVHNFLPYTYYALRGRTRVVVEWSSNNGLEEHNRKVNLKLLDTDRGKNVVCLAVNVCQLADDLLVAFDNFVAKMDKRPAFKNGCVRRHKRAVRPRYIGSKRAHIAGKRDIAQQILAAQRATTGRLRGDQVEWYG